MKEQIRAICEAIIASDQITVSLYTRREDGPYAKQARRILSLLEAALPPTVEGLEGRLVADQHGTPFYNDAEGYSHGDEPTGVWYVTCDGETLFDHLTEQQARLIESLALRALPKWVRVCGICKNQMVVSQWRTPPRVTVAPGQEFPIHERTLDEGLGYVDLDKGVIVVKSDQPDVGKFTILLHELMHISEEKLIAGKIIKRRSKEDYIEAMAGAVSLMLASTGIVAGLDSKAVEAFVPPLPVAPLGGDTV